MAGGGLPEGLVSNKEGVRPVEEGEFLQPRQVAWLWRGILLVPASPCVGLRG